MATATLPTFSPTVLAAYLPGAAKLADECFTATVRAAQAAGDAAYAEAEARGLGLIARADSYHSAAQRVSRYNGGLVCQCARCVAEFAPVVVGAEVAA